MTWLRRSYVCDAVLLMVAAIKIATMAEYLLSAELAAISIGFAILARR